MTNPVTPEFTIAVSSGSNAPEPRLTTLADGRLLATWYDIGANSGDIRHRIFDIDGTALTAELTTPAPSALAGNQTAQSVAALTNGGFVVVWQDFGTDAAGDVRYRVFDAAGDVVATGLATAGEQSGSRQADPAVTGTPDGGFVIAWTDRNATNTNRDEGTDAVVVRPFSATGVALDGIVRVSGPLGSGIAGEIDAGFGSIVGVWDDNALDGIYGAGGDELPLTDEADDFGALGDATMTEAARTPDIAVTSAGVVAVWEQRGTVFYQTDAGFGPGPVVAVAATGFTQGVPRVEALPQGGFVIVWEEFRNPSGNFTSFDILARVFDAQNNPVGAAVNLTAGQTGAESAPDVTALIDGRFMVAWSSQGVAGDVIGRIYDPRTASVTWDGGVLGERFVGADVAGAGDTLNGGGGNDRILGQAGNDLLDGGTGNDTLDGGLGNDTYFVDSTGDVVRGEVASGAGGGIDTVITSVDFTALANIEIIRAAPGTAPLNLTGNDAADTLVGNDGANRLDGRDGNDNLAGNGGTDTLNGGDGTDTLNGGDGDDFIFGGTSTADLRDVAFGGDGRDSIDGGAGNDELNGGNGNDTILGGAGADTLVGNADNDLIAGGAGGDLMSGNAGNDTLNGGFGFDRMNGGTGADQFFHQGVADHGSDWIQDYAAAEGDVLAVGIAGATASQFQVNFATTVGAGSASVQEAFVIYRPTGQVLWALVDGADDTAINLSIGGQVFDLV